MGYENSGKECLYQLFRLLQDSRRQAASGEQLRTAEQTRSLEQRRNRTTGRHSYPPWELWSGYENMQRCSGWQWHWRWTHLPMCRESDEDAISIERHPVRHSGLCWVLREGQEQTQSNTFVQLHHWWTHPPFLGLQKWQWQIRLRQNQRPWLILQNEQGKSSLFQKVVICDCAGGGHQEQERLMQSVRQWVDGHYLQLQ